MDKRLLFVLPLALAACGEAERLNPDPADVALAVHWEACAEGPGSCASIEVPLDWNAPGDETLPFFVRRIPTAEPVSKGQLWLLEGGPGAAGWGFVEVAAIFQSIAPGYDLYLPDYRGTGNSSWLGCEDRGYAFETDPDCMAALLARHGEDLRHYDTTSAALDIGNTIEAIRGAGERVYVYGVSYGTFAVNRYLTLFPDQADGAILDSVCPPTGCDVMMDRNFVEVARFVFEGCAADPLCGEKLGDDPWGKLLDLLGRLEAGHCEAFLGYPSNRIVLEQLVGYATNDAFTAAVATSAVHRLGRCDEADVAALDNLVDWMRNGMGAGFGPGAGSGAAFSPYLSDHVVFSEFWPEGLDRETAEEILAELPFQTGALLSWVEAKDRWSFPPSHTPDSLYAWAPTETPLLLLNGDLDGQTPIDAIRDAEAAFVNEAQHLVEVPLANHGVLATSAFTAEREDFTCGMEIAAAFLADPQGAPKTGCIDRIPGFDFAGPPGLAAALYGTADLWENDAAQGLHIAPALRPAQERALTSLREKLQGPLRF